ncbi:hypothetical protein JF55_02900 [Pseudomonas sp. 1-7]|nr:hypothetical protein JF55_02900 [Pseudomonas sp. 1-7]
MSQVFNANFIYGISTLSIAFGFVYGGVRGSINDKRRGLFSYYLLHLLGIGNIQLAGLVPHYLKANWSKFYQFTTNLPGCTRN